ncbi:MAG TPA: hypothetical protein PKI03_17515 [Pseudomonadota bacterium]|nr:hypothetical protein [Pseudomonadota bacterium]
MKVGINYAWKNYGWDFGEPPRKNSGQLWGGRAAWREHIDAELASFVEMGFFAVRWFLLGDGTTYGTGADRPQLVPGQPPTVTAIPALPPGFVEDFSDLLSRCATHGLQLLPSLVDFHLAFPALPVAGSEGILKAGRSALIIDPERREQFLDQTLAPLLTASADFPDVIYAWEVINEPEWCTQPAGPVPGPPDPCHTVSHEAMRAFIRSGARRINEAGFLSTVGFAYHDSVRGWDSAGLGLTLHQFHYYGEPAHIPAHDFDPRWPLIVGEIATAPHRPWPELGPHQDVASRLRLLAQKGYPATFLWSANRQEETSAVPPAVDFCAENRTRMRDYIRSR